MKQKTKYKLLYQITLPNYFTKLLYQITLPNYFIKSKITIVINIHI